MAEDPVTIPATPVAYSKGKLEPFTGTRYYGLSGVDKSYASAGLDPSVCPHAHFGVRLDTYANATIMFWSPVVGKAERFSAEELLLFGSFIIANHGSKWNLMAWTLPVVAVLVVMADVVAALVSWCLNEPRWVPSLVTGPHTLRAALLQLSAWSWLIAATEITLHLAIAQVGAEVDYALFVGLFVVVGIANLLPWMLTVVIWRSHIKDMGCLSSPHWAPLEVASGVSFLFLLVASADSNNPNPSHPTR